MGRRVRLTKNLHELVIIYSNLRKCPEVFVADERYNLLSLVAELWKPKGGRILRGKEKIGVPENG